MTQEPKTNYSDQRDGRRISMALPVSLEQGAGQTRDVSVSGVFFETESEFSPGSRIRFSLQLDNLYPDLAVQVLYEGKIVRVERRGGRMGVAVAIESQRIEAASKEETI